MEIEVEGYRILVAPSIAREGPEVMGYRILDWPDKAPENADGWVSSHDIEIRAAILEAYRRG